MELKLRPDDQPVYDQSISLQRRPSRRRSSAFTVASNSVKSLGRRASKILSQTSFVIEDTVCFDSKPIKKFFSENFKNAILLSELEVCISINGRLIKFSRQGE